ncbi:LysR family transcriptional regulator [Ktedonosporobacter rubrisoli]|uniref:LysR family transcriptional regulator n=1 Tax=Ktedonosporobacter rubrisoli TaxID=2509675 RepID=A0A4P6JKN7_KTERU|nr:LysR family transcriptional regulator [Ktedonosporobacter rubrisoli]QBD75550.1 LysR family transcriptional regulator [Ktedonosporobacter rubrisoli]
MELRNLRHFMVVAEEMNFTRAAERLQIAQPALTRSIHNLEEELQVLLFDRSKRQIALTPAGQGFLKQAYLIFADVEAAIQIARQFDQGKLGYLAIGFTGAAIYSVLPQIVHTYQERFPEVEVVLHELSMREQVTALSEHRLDIGFAVAPSLVENLAYERLLECSMVVVLPETHPLASRARVALAELAKEPWIWFPRKLNPHYHDQNTRLCQQAGFEPRIVQETAHPHIMASLVAAGLGVAMMSAWTQSLKREGIVFKPLLEPSWSVDLQMMRRKQETSPLIAAFTSLAREISSKFHPDA